MLHITYILCMSSAGFYPIWTERKQAWKHDYPDWGFPCFSPPIKKSLSQNDTRTQNRRFLQLKCYPFWVQLPDISHANEILLVKDNVPDEIIFPHVAIAPSQYIEAFSQDSKPVSINISPFIFHKVLFTNFIGSMGFVRTNGSIQKGMMPCVWKSLGP
jgi:hypothetical protein